MIELRRWKESFPLFALLLIACSSGDDADGPRTFSMEFCSGEGPVWVAQQDGHTGTWQRVTPTSADRWDFAFASDRGGIAWVWVPDGSLLEVFLGSTDELASVFGNSSGSPFCRSITSDVEVAIAGVPEDDVAIVSLDGQTDYATEGPGVLRWVTHGTWPLVAVRAHRSGPADMIAERIILRRAVSVPGTGVVTPPIDFNDPESFAAATANLTVTSLAPSDGEARVETFFRGGGTHATLSLLRMTFDSNVKVYGAIPIGQLDAGELQGVSVGVSGSSYRGVTAYFREADDVSVAVGPELATPTISIAAAYPNLRPRVLLPRQAEYGWSVDARFLHPSHSVSVVATGAYLGHPAVWDIVVPDFYGVDGWDVGWGLPPPESLGLEAYMRFVAASSRPWFDDPADGSIGRVASRYQSPSMAQLDVPQPRFMR